MLGHIEMHLATLVFQHDQYEQHPHVCRRASKGVERRHFADMVVQEGFHVCWEDAGPCVGCGR